MKDKNKIGLKDGEYNIDECFGWVSCDNSDIKVGFRCSLKPK